jgi:hypothetical protein
MDIFDAPLALLGFLGLVAVAPPWFWFINNYSGLSALGPSSTFMINLMFPALVLIFIASWLEGGASV